MALMVGALSVFLHAQSDSEASAPASAGEAASSQAAGDGEITDTGITDSEITDETQLTFDDDEEATADPPTGELGGFNTWDFVRMVLVLAGVIGAIYLVFWFLKRRTRGPIQNSRVIRVIGSQGLPGNKGLHLVEIGNHVFLVGTGDDTVRLISEITDKDSLDELQLLASQQESARPKSFGEALSGFFSAGASSASVGGGVNGGSLAEEGGALSAGGGSGAVDASGAAPLDFLHKQRERLKNLR